MARGRRSRRVRVRRPSSLPGSMVVVGRNAQVL